MSQPARGKRPGKIRINKEGIEKRQSDSRWKTPLPPQKDSNPKGGAFSVSPWEKTWAKNYPTKPQSPLKPKTSKPVPMPRVPNLIDPMSGALRRNFVWRNRNT